MKTKEKENNLNENSFLSRRSLKPYIRLRVSVWTVPKISCVRIQIYGNVPVISCFHLEPWKAFSVERPQRPPGPAFIQGVSAAEKALSIQDFQAAFPLLLEFGPNIFNERTKFFGNPEKSMVTASGPHWGSLGRNSFSPSFAPSKCYDFFKSLLPNAASHPFNIFCFRRVLIISCRVQQKWHRLGKTFPWPLFSYFWRISLGFILILVSPNFQ